MTRQKPNRKEEHEPVPSDAFRQGLGDFLDRALKGERTTITRHGKPVAVLVPVSDAA